MDDEAQAVSASSPISLALQAQLEILKERDDQRLEFPEAEDDALTPAEWIARIVKHLGRAVTLDRRQYRRTLVVVGALALAAIESYDRRYGAHPQ